VLVLILNSIESMKMETVIRSPQKGVVAKLVHKEGVSILLAQLPCNSLILYRIYVRQGLFLCSSKRRVQCILVHESPKLTHNSTRNKSRFLFEVVVSTSMALKAIDAMIVR
jgi:hypothetical protein